jgi:hypothetical protein
VRSLFERLARNLVRRGIRDGLLGGNGIWLALGAAAWLVRWLSRTPAQRVVTEVIRVGETITITSVPAPAYGRQARKLTTADRKAAELARRQVNAERKRAPERAVAPAAGSSSSEAKAAKRAKRDKRG